MASIIWPPRNSSSASFSLLLIVCHNCPTAPSMIPMMITMHMAAMKVNPEQFFMG
jgi:hypothetical protein